jgi:phosphoglycolate phosphatase
MIENCIFDLDGTLSDPSEGIFRSLHFAFEAIGRHDLKDRKLEWFIGPPIVESLRKILSDGSELQVDEALKHFRTRYGTAGKFENRLYDGIPELLTKILRRAVRTYVATSKPHAFAHDVLNHFGLAGHFVDIQGHDISVPSETKAEVLGRLLDRQSIDPAKTLMVGDRHHDVNAAYKFSISCVGVLWGFGHPEEFDHPNVIATISRPEELIEVIDRLACATL